MALLCLSSFEDGGPGKAILSAETEAVFSAESEAEEARMEAGSASATRSGAPGPGRWLGLTAAIAAAAVLQALAWHVAGTGPWRRPRSLATISARASRGSSSNTSKGTFCSNWRALALDELNLTAARKCQSACAERSGCTSFMFKAGDGCSKDPAPDASSCVLLGGTCDSVENKCWQLHEISSPKPADWYLFSEKTTCSNWADVRIKEDTVDSEEQCGLACQEEKGCAAFSFQPGECSQEDGGEKGSCLLLSGGCSMMESGCYDLYQMGVEPIVTITSGKIRGVEVAGVAGFLGVPFGQPPLGELRFAPPQPAQSWDTEVRDATKVGNACMQALPWFPEIEWIGESEDCLYLNAYAPANALGRNASLPVMVYFHGGSFASGLADSLWNITRLTGVVVFSPQYRLGTMGFFATEVPPPNYGILDQQLALKWVQQNARAFGGDPDRVMILGNSAGGASVAAHLLLPESKGLFSSASMESPGGHQGWMMDRLRINDDWMVTEQLVDLSRELAEQVGCGSNQDLDCLRNVAGDELMRLGKEMRFAPALGPDEYPLDLIRQGKWNRVPVIIGETSCESCRDAQTSLGSADEEVMDDRFRGALQGIFMEGCGVSVDDLEEWYAERIDKEGRWRTFARILGDSGHSCSSTLTAEALRATSGDVWRYYFEHVDPEDDLPGAPHTSEIPWMFAQAEAQTPEQQRLQRAMASWWTSLAAYGDPNVGSTSDVLWPQHSDEEPLVMFLDEEPRVDANEETVRQECSHWKPFIGWSEP